MGNKSKKGPSTTLAEEAAALDQRRQAQIEAQKQAINRLLAVSKALKETLEEVVDLHRQHSDIGLEPGKWCPVDGEEEPCRTKRIAGKVLK